MKTIIYKSLAVISLCGLTLTGWAADKAYTTDKQKFSYAVGVQLANNIRQQGLKDIDAAALAQAIEDVLTGQSLKVSAPDMQAALVAYQQKMMQERKSEADKAKVAGDKFRAENKKKKGVKELKNGMQYQVLTKGKGKKPSADSKVTVHYHGTLVNGTVFDSSVKRNQPASFPVNGVIKGWQEILPMMPVGSKWKVVIPPDLAYGERGVGGSIGPNETLIFEIELISID